MLRYCILSMFSIALYNDDWNIFDDPRSVVAMSAQALLSARGSGVTLLQI